MRSAIGCGRRLRRRCTGRRVQKTLVRAEIANSIGVGVAFFTAVLGTDVTWADFTSGLRIAFNLFQIFYSLLKATIFGGAIAFFCSYEGYVADVGAEGVGRSTARAVVMTSVAILVLDAFIAALFAPRLQG